MGRGFVASIVVGAVLAAPVAGAAQETNTSRRAAHAGWAVVTVDRNEYTIVIECTDAARPELGFRTQTNRVTRAATGRSNMVGLMLRPWKETGDVIVTLEKYVAWLPAPASSGGVLSLELDMSPVSVVRDGAPALLTYDMWQSGERAPGSRAAFRATCGEPNEAAPAYRRLPDRGAEGG